MKSNWMSALVFFMLALGGSTCHAEGKAYSFGVLSVRSVLLTAQYWNPILAYVSKKSGVPLELRLSRSSEETSDAEIRGEYDFVYDNHIFAPSHAAAGYRPLARAAGKPIRGQIVVPEASPIKSLHELQGKEIGAPSNTAFAAYAVTMSALIKAGVAVTPVFAGNQEGVLWQLKAGLIPAASLNSKVVQEYSVRENFKYRALWTSEDFFDFPFAVHPRVPAQEAKAVQDALVNMVNDPEGLKILKASAAVIKLEPPYGFVPAQDSEYQNQREVYRTIRKMEAR